MSTRVWDIVPFVPLAAGARQFFSYREPPGTRLLPGMIVRVPFGPRFVEGLVWQKATGRPRVRYLKTIVEMVGDAPLFLASELNALGRLADASLESAALLAKSAVAVRRTALTLSRLPKSTERRRKSLPDGRGMRAEKYSNILQNVRVCSGFRPMVRWEEPSRVLPRRAHGQTLLLVPELAIGRRVLGALEQRHIPAALFAQTLRTRERRAVVRRLSDGEPLAVVATHAGIFLPFPALQQIIVIEAALASHRQWDLHPRYDARVAALLLARERGVPITFQTSLPSLDLTNVEHVQKYPSSKNQAPKNAGLSSSHALPLSRWQIAQRSAHDPLLLPETLKTLRDALEHNGSVFLFHDIVGTERVFSCATCGHTLRCAQCQGILERAGGILRCRLCGLPAGRAPSFCPRCRSPHIGPKRIGTAALVHDLQREFPQVPIERLDRETLPRQRQQKTGNAELGTGLFLGSERAFAALGVTAFDAIIVLSADRILEEAAFDAAERFAQLTARLAQYARPGASLLLQTTHAQQPVVRALAAGSLDDWIGEEMADREQLRYPPSAATLTLEQHFPTEPRAARATQSLRDLLQANSDKLQAGARIVGLPPRVRAEFLLRGSLPSLQHALTRMPAGWSTNPVVPLSVLLSA